MLLPDCGRVPVWVCVGVWAVLSENFFEKLRQLGGGGGTGSGSFDHRLTEVERRILLKRRRTEQNESGTVVTITVMLISEKSTHNCISHSVTSTITSAAGGDTFEVFRRVGSGDSETEKLLESGDVIADNEDNVCRLYPVIGFLDPVSGTDDSCVLRIPLLSVPRSVRLLRRLPVVEKVLDDGTPIKEVPDEIDFLDCRYGL